MKTSRVRRRVLGIASMSSILAVTFLACSSTNEGNTFHGNGGGSSGTGGSGASGSGGSSGSAGSGGPSLDSSFLDAPSVTDGPQFDPDAFWANDPPPASCDGGPTPPPPGGTPDCPDDKHREGCPCIVDGKAVAVGTQADCWPGYRKNRHHGICKDGATTCQAVGENGAAWGPCDGYVLPDANATSGPSACKCFSQGQWKIDNLEPCFVSYQGQPSGSAGAISTVMSGGNAQCPPEANQSPLVKPTQDWSPNSLTVDCAGHFKLCYTLKAGDAKNPQASDCVLAQSCTEGDYPQEGVATTFPPLPSWVVADAAGIACAEQFTTSGGYGEMSVEGLSVECDDVPGHVFNRVQYCKLCCNDNSCPNDPTCASCGNGGSGTFN